MINWNSEIKSKIKVDVLSEDEGEIMMLVRVKKTKNPQYK